MILLLLVALAASPAPKALPGATAHTDLPTWRESTPEKIAESIDQIAALPELRDRILSASERFLGTPYQFDPLGEGPGHKPDEDPRLRWDRVDCQTYVETVMAISRAKSPASLLGVMDDIRYDGAPSYEQRNHFFEAHWLAANTRKGYVRDLAPQIAGKDVVHATKVVTKAQWKARTLGEKIKLPDERAPIGQFSFTYLPLGKLLQHAKDIPSGTIFAVVREDRAKLPTMVSHLGLVVQKADGTWLRQAGSAPYMQVIDEQVAHMVERNLTSTKWPVLGLMLLEVQPKP